MTQPTVKVHKHIETIVELTLPFDEIRKQIEVYVQAKYEAFKIPGLELEIDFMKDHILIRGYKLET
jgi:hypothetical protein